MSFSVHRLVVNYSAPEGSGPINELTVSYSDTNGRCPNYGPQNLPRVSQCYCISSAYTYSPPPPLPPLAPGETLPVTEVPLFHLYVGKCITLGAHDGVGACQVTCKRKAYHCSTLRLTIHCSTLRLTIATCNHAIVRNPRTALRPQELIEHDCLYLQGATTWELHPWFFAHIRATCYTQEHGGGASVVTRCASRSECIGARARSRGRAAAAHSPDPGRLTLPDA